LKAREVLTICKPIHAGWTKSRSIVRSEWIPEFLSGFFSQFTYFGSKDSMIPNMVYYRNFYRFGETNGAGVNALEFSFHGHTVQKLINHFVEQLMGPTTTDREGHEDLTHIQELLGIATREQTDKVEGVFMIKIRKEIERMFTLNKDVIEKFAKSKFSNIFFIYIFQLGIPGFQSQSSIFTNLLEKSMKVSNNIIFHLYFAKITHKMSRLIQCVENFKGYANNRVISTNIDKIRSNSKIIDKFRLITTNIDKIRLISTNVDKIRSIMAKVNRIFCFIEKSPEYEQNSIVFEKKNCLKFVFPVPGLQLPIPGLIPEEIFPELTLLFLPSSRTHDRNPSQAQERNPNQLPEDFPLLRAHERDPNPLRPSAQLQVPYAGDTSRSFPRTT
jgi:hypothetical protein